MGTNDDDKNADVALSPNKDRIVELRAKKEAGTLTEAEQSELKSLERTANDEVNNPPRAGN